MLLLPEPVILDIPRLVPFKILRTPFSRLVKISPEQLIAGNLSPTNWRTSLRNGSSSGNWQPGCSSNVRRKCLSGTAHVRFVVIPLEGEKGPFVFTCSADFSYDQNSANRSACKKERKIEPISFDYIYNRSTQQDSEEAVVHWFAAGFSQGFSSFASQAIKPLLIQCTTNEKGAGLLVLILFSVPQMKRAQDCLNNPYMWL